MKVKDLYIAEHERLVEEYMEAHPDVSWDEAYDRCADGAYSAVQDRYADMVDQARQRQKDGE